MRRRRVVITGLGVLAPNGCGKDTFWQACLQGRSDVRPITRFVTNDLPTRIAGEIAVQKKLTITLDERVYEGLHAVVGRRRISGFIESLVRPYVIGKDLETAYRQMAQEEAREAEALEWAEATIGDIADETR